MIPIMAAVLSADDLLMLSISVLTYYELSKLGLVNKIGGKMVGGGSCAFGSNNVLIVFLTLSTPSYI